MGGLPPLVLYMTRCVLSEEELRKKLASVKSLRNLCAHWREGVSNILKHLSGRFRDADVDSDGQLSRDEARLAHRVAHEKLLCVQMPPV